jgi:hypothetical protein
MKFWFKHFQLLAFVAAIAAALLISDFSFAAGNSVKRYAFVIGANNGGEGRVLLKYAVSDAAKFKKVMIDLGGVESEDMFTLYNPDKTNFYSSVAKLASKIKKDAPGYRKRELFFYYSGHSDSTGLLLGRDKVSYSELKKAIKDIDVDVRIVILDSCSSGAFTRTKGGSVEPSFLVDSSYDMKGNAFMTSSAADEVSQESDYLRSSFFTYYVIAGMRGAADISQDNKITLNEVYQFAYSSTLSRTQATSGGPQHPNYRIEMIGTGDVILTDVGTNGSRLAFDDQIEGKIFVKDSNDTIVAEFSKSYGQPVVLGLSEGRYHVINNTFSGRTEKADITVPENRTVTISKGDFTGTSREESVYRGDESSTFSSRIRENVGSLVGDRPEKEESSSGSEGEYLFSKKVHFSGYGGFSTLYGTNGQDGQWLSGGRGGLIINDTFVIGGGGFGMNTPLSTDEYSSADFDSEYSYFNYSLGGMLFEYYFFPKRLFTYSIGIIVGGGAVSFSDSSSGFEDADYGSHTSAFFAMVPEFNAYVNVARFFRMGAGVYYVYAGGLNNDYIKSGDIRNFGFQVLFNFGWF